MDDNATETGLINKQSVEAISINKSISKDLQAQLRYIFRPHGSHSSIQYPIELE